MNGKSWYHPSQPQKNIVVAIERLMIDSRSLFSSLERSRTLYSCFVKFAEQSMALYE